VTARGWLRACGFKVQGEQPAGATDYLGYAGIFRIRVRLPLDGCRVIPELWIGFAVGGPLIERPSYVRYETSWRAAEDAVMLRRVFSGC
jgi:hypothetical protein